MKKTKFMALALLPMLLISCSQEVENVITEDSKSVVYEQPENPVQLVEKLENPYSVSTMRKAFDNLTGNTINTSGAKLSGKNVAKMSVAAGINSDDIITTTHYYLKFKPKTEEELELIKKDTTLYFFDAPLDYEISEGEAYRDPEVPDDQPTYQYTYAKVDHVLPENVEYEILEELFVPEEEDEDTDIDVTLPEDFNQEEIAYNQKIAKVTQSVSLNNNSNYQSVMLALEEEALRLTNNLEEKDPDEEKVTGWFSSKKWTPKGRIRVQDDTLGFVPIKGIKVRVGRWFSWDSDTTDSKGEFKTKRRRTKAYYKMDWEKYHFALRSGAFSSAQKSTSRKKGDWNWDIKDGEHRYFAHIFRAAYHYYYQDRQGLRSPKKNSFWRSKLRIAAYTQSNPSYGSYDPSSHSAGLVSGLKVYTYKKNSDMLTYATVIHELAHSAHYEMSNKSDFEDYSLKLKETWAKGVEGQLVRMIYPNYDGGEFPYLTSEQIVIDLIDGVDDKNEGRESILTDEVTGYTIKELEDALLGAKNWEDWKKNIKDDYKNDTEKHLDKLFNYYFN